MKLQSNIYYKLEETKRYVEKNMNYRKASGVLCGEEF
jgi:hypothetical protein